MGRISGGGYSLGGEFRLTAWFGVGMVRTSACPERVRTFDLHFRFGCADHARFLNSTHETALIIEDDIDWDIHLRTKQVPQTAYAIRSLLDQTDSTELWGSLDSWDLLYLGHCGDNFHPDNATGLPFKIYTDKTMPKRDELHPFTQDFLTGLGVEEDDPQQRLVHQSVQPLCSFAYAVTRSAAQRIVDEIAVREPPEGCKAYDVRLMLGCAQEGLRCVTVNPELFHHNDGPSEIAALDDDQGEDAQHLGDRDTLVAAAPNIRCSVRSLLWSERGPSFMRNDPVMKEEYKKRLLWASEESDECVLDW